MLIGEILGMNTLSVVTFFVVYFAKRFVCGFTFFRF
jgi:hypothetical protein